MHFTGIIEDDNVGRAAQKSLLDGDGVVMDDTIRYHRQVSTRFDSTHFTRTGLGRQLVIGNRWAHQDLNFWIRANQPEFRLETHSAEGGCCARHPAGVAIFPEEYSMDRLATERRILGSYDYSHMYLNQSVMPEECIFKPEWIRHYWFRQGRPDLPLDDIRNILMIEHQVKEGEVIDDLAVGQLSLRMIVDLAHAKKRKRCKHVVLVIGLEPETDRFYLLDVWAQAGPYSDLLGKMYEMAEKWSLSEVFLETVAAQNLLKFHIEETNSRSKRPLFVHELPYDNSENAKKNRIESMQPIYRNGQFWTHTSHSEFHNEYDSYPAVATVDVLDCIGYAPLTFDVIRRREVMESASRQRQEFRDRRVSAFTGY